MDQDTIALFHELVDRPASEREAFYAQRQIPAAVRAEVESLLRFDATSGQSVGSYVAAAAEEALLASAPATGTRFGPFRPVRVVGRGGMGVVYEAEQDSPRRIVALKVIHPGLTTPELVRRFEQESQALGRLQHAGIAQIYEAGTADTGSGPQPYFAMEFVRGKPLCEYAESHHLDTRARLELMVRICDAVHHAHQRGIIHRDLKPANILVDQTGQPKVLDFGVARVTDSEVQASRQTDVGQLIGTLSYMSPEQVLADPLELDTRSDVYALGAILYELLAGRLPYNTTGKLHEVVQTIREQEPVPLGAARREYRGDIETIAGKALEKDKVRRYASAAELAADIRRYLQDEPVIARPPSAVYQFQKFAKRHKALVAGVAVVFVVLVAGIVVSTWQAARALRAEQEALLALNRARTAEEVSTQERDRAVAAGKQADEERNRALAQKERADTETATAKAISEFLQNDLLAQASASTQASPNTKPDPDLKVRAVLDRAAERISGKFEAQPLVEASVRETIGGTYRDLGVYPEAQRQFERAYELRRRTSGENDPGTLILMNYLAQLHRLQGRFAQAESLLIKTLEIQRRLFGEEHPETLNTMNSLAAVYREQRKDTQAEAILTKSLDIRRRLLGEEHQSTLTTMNNLSLHYWGQGKNKEAEALLEKTLEIRTRRFGEEHPDTFSTMNSLASVYFTLGKSEQAETLFAKTLELRRRLLGEEHPNTITSMQNLGVVYMYRGKYEQAESILTKTLEARRRVVGEEHPTTLQTIHNLGALYRRQEKYTQAEAFMSKANEIRRRVLGEEHPETLSGLSEMAQIFHGQGKSADAGTLFAKVLDARRRVLGPAHPETLSSMASLSEVWLEQQKYTEAEALLREAMSGREKSTPGAWENYKVQSLLGAVLADEKQYEAAEPLLLSAYEGLIQRETLIQAADRVLIGRTRDRIIQLYEDWKKPEKTAQWRASEGRH